MSLFARQKPLTVDSTIGNSVDFFTKKTNEPVSPMYAKTVMANAYSMHSQCTFSNILKHMEIYDTKKSI